VKNEELKAKFDDLLSRAHKVNSERNRLIHADYFVLLNEYDEFQGTLHRKLRDASKDAIKGGGHAEAKDVTPKALTVLAEEIEDVGYHMRIWAEAYVDLPED
jgi:hypothetical protein